MSMMPNHGENGEWITIGRNTCRCSICDFVISKRLAKKKDMCPNCGCFTKEIGKELNVNVPKPD